MSLFSAVAVVILAGCGSREPESPRPVAVVTLEPHATPTLAAAPRAVAIATPSPALPPHTLADMRPRKTFVDPPLPPELLDDGGLRPLPPSTTR